MSNKNISNQDRSNFFDLNRFDPQDDEIAESMIKRDVHYGNLNPRQLSNSQKREEDRKVEEAIRKINRDSVRRLGGRRRKIK